jgi:hypothetical protein
VDELDLPQFGFAALGRPCTVNRPANVATARTSPPAHGGLCDHIGATYGLVEENLR